MTFDNIDNVEIDDNGDYFYITKTSGTVYRYRFDDSEAYDFFYRIVDSGAVDIYRLNSEGERQEQETEGDKYDEEY